MEREVEEPALLLPKVRSNKKCAKRCFKNISVGPLDNGLYFKKKQQYSSVCSGIFTLLGVLGILGITIKVLVDIISRKMESSELIYKQFDVKDYGISVSDFFQRT